MTGTPPTRCVVPNFLLTLLRSSGFVVCWRRGYGGINIDNMESNDPNVSSRFLHVLGLRVERVPPLIRNSC